jgi:hypothetical protein
VADQIQMMVNSIIRIARNIVRVCLTDVVRWTKITLSFFHEHPLKRGALFYSVNCGNSGQF